MSLNKSLIAELKMEAASTRKILESVPVSKNDWKPHDKSMSLGRLVTHIVELPGWITMTLATDELDFLKFTNKPVMPGSVEELLARHDEAVDQAVAMLEGATEEDFDKTWTLRRGDHVIFALPKKVVIRSSAMNHFIHHRGQLSVYLRMLDVHVPGMYGPSADDMILMQAANAEMAK